MEFLFRDSERRDAIYIGKNTVISSTHVSTNERVYRLEQVKGRTLPSTSLKPFCESSTRGHNQQAQTHTKQRKRMKYNNNMKFYDEILVESYEEVARGPESMAAYDSSVYAKHLLFDAI